MGGRFSDWRLQPSEWTRSQLAVAAAVGLPAIYWLSFSSGSRKKRHAGPTGFNDFLKEAPAAPGEPVTCNRPNNLSPLGYCCNAKRW